MIPLLLVGVLIFREIISRRDAIASEKGAYNFPNYAKKDRTQDTGSNGKIKLKIPPLYAYITRQISDPAEAIAKDIAKYAGQ